MAYKQLKDSINETIRKNGNQEITGPVLNLALTAIINTVGTGSSYMGLAEKVTTPGSPDRPVFYLATGSNPFPNFGGFTPKRDGLHLFHWNPDSKSWLCKTIVDFNEPVDFDSKVKVSVSAPLKGDGTSGNPINIPKHSYESKTDESSISGSGTAASPVKLKKVSTKGPVSGSGTASDPLVIDSYSKLESDKSLKALDDKKVDKTVYGEDLASLEEYKESQSELNAKQDIGINKNLQNINQLNDMIKVLSQKDEPIMTAKGGEVINLPNNAMRSVAPKYKFEGLTVKNLSKVKQFEEPTNGILKGLNKEYGNNYTLSVKDGWQYFQNTETGSLRLSWNYYSYYEPLPNDKFYTSVLIDVIEIDDGVVGLINLNSSIKPARLGLQVLSMISDGHTKPNIGVETSTKFKGKVRFKYPLCVNLTQTFGAGNEPTKEWCDEHIQGYFEGVKSVQSPMRIRSVGENLAGRLIDNQWAQTDGEIKGNSSFKRTGFIPIPANTKCKAFHSVAGKTRGIAFYDRLKNFVSRSPYDQNGIMELQSTVSGFVVASFEKKDINDEYFLWFGDSNEKPESYTDSLAYFNDEIELKSVGEIKDYIENGKLYKCISDDGEILEETEVVNLSTSGQIVNKPNGTIFIEPVTNLTAFYNDGLDVSNFNIESVEEFAIFKDGNYQSLDVSKIEITDNKLTHPDAINGLCYLVFRYDNAPIFGDNEVEYYNNDGILVSPDGTFWKPVLTVDDEGNVLMKGEKL